MGVPSWHQRRGTSGETHQQCHDRVSAASSPRSQSDVKVHTWAQLARLQQEDAASYEAFCMFSLLRPSKPLPLPLLRLLWLALYPNSTDEALAHHLEVLSSFSLVTRLNEAASAGPDGQLVYYTAAAHSASTKSSPLLSAAAADALSQRISSQRLLVLTLQLLVCGAGAALLALACRQALPSTLSAALAGAGTVVGCWFVWQCVAACSGELLHDAACRNQLAVLLLGYAQPRELLAAAQARLGLIADGACAGVTPRLTECAWAPPEDFTRSSSLHFHLGEVLRSCGDMFGAEECLRRDVALKTRQLPPGHLQLVRSLHTLACALHGQGQEQAALRVLQDAPPLHPESFPLSSPDLAWELDEGAAQPMDDTQLAEALAANEEALAMQRMLLPASHRDLALTLHIRAALLRARGSYQSALEAAEEAVSIWRASLPPPPSDDISSNPAEDDCSGSLQLANGLHNLAWQRRACGDWPGALQACQEVLQLRKQLLPPGAAGIGLSLVQQAWILSDMGQHKPAQAAHDDAWDVFCTASPAAAAAAPTAAAAPAAARCVARQPELSEEAKQRVEAALLFQHAWLLREQGQQEAAAAACRQALALQQMLYPPQHAATAASLALHATIMADAGWLDNALQLCGEALAMRQALYPHSHPDVAVSLSQKAWLLDRQGDHAAADDLCRQALVLRSKVFPRLHRDIALSLQQQAVLLKSQSNMKLAAAVCAQALEMQQLLFGGGAPNHRDIAATLQLQAWLHNDQGQQDEAAVVCKRGLAMRRQLFPRQHRETAQSLEQLAWLRLNEGRLEASSLACSEALHMRRKLLPAVHSEVADSLYQQAWLLIAKGEMAAAADACQQALAMRRQLLPAEHKDVLASLQQQAWLQSRGVAARGA